MLYVILPAASESSKSRFKEASAHSSARAYSFKRWGLSGCSPDDQTYHDRPDYFDIHSYFDDMISCLCWQHKTWQGCWNLNLSIDCLQSSSSAVGWVVLPTLFPASETSSSSSLPPTTTSTINIIIDTFIIFTVTIIITLHFDWSWTSIYNIPILIMIRGANFRQIRSFFEHCSKSLWPPLPLRFEHHVANFFWGIS